MRACSSVAPVRPTSLPSLRAAALACARAAVCFVGLVCPVSVLAEVEADAVGVQVTSPGVGAKVANNLHHARITGNALAHGAGAHLYDVMLVIDVSHSTRAASGSDVDGDGLVGVDPHTATAMKLPPGVVPRDVRSTDPQDTILHAQAQAARALLADLDPRRVRVGIVSFSGEVNPVTGERRSITQEDARVETPLTDDYAAVEQTLRAMLARGPNGATNYAAGIRLALVELNALSGARSGAAPDREKVMLFLSDGLPTFPTGKGNEQDPGDVDAAIRAAELASRSGIVINTYALGSIAMRFPRALTEMARVGRGTYTPVQRPGEIVALLGGVTFADVEDVIFTNLTTGDLSTDVKLNPDGSFTGYVPVREGRNRVRVTALASDGRRGDAEFDFEFEHKELGDRTQVAELERIRRQNRRLQIEQRKLEIEAFRAEQRRRVDISVETDPAEDEQPEADR